MGLESVEQSSRSDHTLESDHVIVFEVAVLFFWECYKSIGFMETFCEGTWRKRANSAHLIRHDAF